MNGHAIRLGRLTSAGPTVVVAIDHGEFDGPIAHLEDAPKVARGIDPSVDAILLSPGMIGHCVDVFGRKGSPAAIVRLNWATTYCFSWNYTQAETVAAMTAAEAAAAGADAVLISLSLQSGSERCDARNVKVFSRLAAGARKIGLPVIGEYFPARGEHVQGRELFEEVKIGVRILAELGSDAVKTFHTEDFAQVAGGCPVPVWALGASKKKTMRDALALARREIDDGARGVVFGRNAFSWPRAAAFQRALVDVVRHGKAVDQAMTSHELKD